MSQTKEAIASEGILLIDKPIGVTSFFLVKKLRRILNVKKIGHAGTLDPLATGVMVLLVGQTYTKKSDQFLNQTKEYEATLTLGISTDSYDAEGSVTKQTDPPLLSQETINQVIAQFQGKQQQIPPMFSAKKVQGKKLYLLAREGKTIERQPVVVEMQITFLEYSHPTLKIQVECSKGTYIRSLAHDMGEVFGCGAHLSALRRTRSGDFTIAECLNWDEPEVFSQKLVTL